MHYVHNNHVLNIYIHYVQRDRNYLTVLMTKNTHFMIFGPQRIMRVLKQIRLELFMIIQSV